MGAPLAALKMLASPRRPSLSPIDCSEMSFKFCASITGRSAGLRALAAENEHDYMPRASTSTGETNEKRAGKRDAMRPWACAYDLDFRLFSLYFRGKRFPMILTE
jgi:hypothetical protein